MEQEDVLAQIDRFVYRCVKDLRHLGATVSILLVLLIVFTQLMAVPARVTASSMESAKAAIVATDTNMTTVENRLNSESPWYKRGAGYVDDLQGKLDAAKAEQNLAKDAYTKAEGEGSNPDARWTDAGAASSHASVATQKLKEINDRLIAIAQQRATARQQYQQVMAELGQTRENVQTVSDRFTRERGQYLTKYVTEPDTWDDQAASQLSSAGTALENARLALPADNETGKGDPAFALSQLSSVQGHTSQATQLAAQITERLNYLATASRDAAPRTAQANTLHDQIVGYVNGLAGQTGYWFKGPYATLDQSLALYRQAQTALDTPTAEGKKDLPAAYELSGQSIGLSNGAKGAADGEVADAQAAARAIDRIASRINEVNGYIGNADSAESTLSSYHAGPTWSNVSGNTREARSLVSAASTRRANAQRLSSLDVQQFADARREAEGGLSGLDRAQSLAQEVVSTASTLETIRARWPGAQSAAVSAINGSSSNISSYGSYDSGAKSDYDSAVSLLSQARSNASSRYYQNAVDQANRAAQLANGAGDRAYSSYLAYKRAQEEAERRAEQARRDAAAAAQRAAEEAARRQSQPSGGSYGGGSSGGYGSGNSGSYGSGSDSHWGGSSGGSDSSWK